MTRMRKRIVFGAVLIAVLAALLWGDWRLERFVRETSPPEVGAAARPTHLLVGLPTVLVVAALAAGAFFELSRMARGAGLEMLPVSGLAGTLAAATGAWWFLPAPALGPLSPVAGQAGLVVLLGLVFAEQMVRRRTEGGFARVAATAMAIVYLGACAGLIVHIRLAHGVGTMVLFLAAAKFTDIGAYFTGSLAGRHKLIPWLSPGKTWEGLAGGIALGAGASVAVVAVSAMGPEGTAGGIGLSLGRAAAFGAAVGLAGQFADLCESLLKRSANLKDSGSLVPEFGGILDMIDSVLLSAPVAALLLALLAG